MMTDWTPRCCFEVLVDLVSKGEDEDNGHRLVLGDIISETRSQKISVV